MVSMRDGDEGRPGKAVLRFGMCVVRSRIRFSWAMTQHGESWYCRWDMPHWIEAPTVPCKILGVEMGLVGELWRLPLRLQLPLVSTVARVGGGQNSESVQHT